MTKREESVISEEENAYILHESAAFAESRIQLLERLLFH